MAAYTWSQLRALVQQQADIENSTFVATSGSPNELDHYLNLALEELQNELVAAWGDEAFATSLTINTTAGVAAYSTAQSDGLYPIKILSLHLFPDGASSAELILLRQFQQHSVPSIPGLVPVRVNWKQSPPRYATTATSLQFDSAPDAVYTLSLTYVRPVVKYNITTHSATTITELSSYAEYLVNSAVIMCMLKEESDTTQREMRRQTLLEQLRRMGPNRDFSQPTFVQDHRALDEDAAPHYWETF